ncbi:nocobactin polyketide synthase NbtC [Nocardia sp. alder85J]|uniref:nocobactin polyketide synthase NbtC n=1 Tax=Nocardia sp. alder85J TaxID=2862949 RepID=UPI001CD1D543|nr:nocobactin polyketide synthase NbtC [Nocardia sp. alder85J]MCX4093133.1 nocobactin polyketide synthase NbtC [Nocardia sp. alder85J]
MSDHRLPDGRSAVLLSADRAEGLRAEARALLDYLEAHPRITPDRVAHMLFRTRGARRQRALARVGARDELLDALRAIAAGKSHAAVTAATAGARRIGFVFPGQGGGRPGPGKRYYEVSEVYRARVDECAAVFRTAFGHDRPLHYLLDTPGAYHDVVSEMQPAILFHMLGLAALWQAAGVRPVATVAHSLGELAAMVVAGAMTLEQAVVVAGRRSRLAEALPGADGYTMAVLGTDREQCEELLARQPGWAELAVINAPNLMVICGERATVEALTAEVQERGQFARGFTLRFPAHTSLITGLRAEFEAAVQRDLADATFAATDITCYGSTLGAAVGPEVAQAQYWYWNLRNRVRFDKAVAAAVRDGIDTLIEMSDHPVLQLAVQDNLTALGDPDTLVLGTSLRSATDLGEFARNLATLAVHDTDFDWEALRVGPAEPTPLPLPNFPHTRWERRRIWSAYPTIGDPAPDPTAVHRLVEHWMPIPLPAPSAPRRVLFVDHTGRCPDLAATLTAAAERRGDPATLLDARQLANGVPRLGGHDRVVVLAPASPTAETATAIAEFADFFAGRGWLPALDVLTAGGQGWLFTVTGESVLGTDPAPLGAPAAIAAGFRCVGMEYPELTLRHLDLPAADLDAGRADLVLAALDTTGESELALRGGTLYTKRLVPEHPAVAPGTGPDLTHVLIVGGTGQVGLRCCEHAVRAGAERVTLLSRSGETPDTAGQLAVIRRLGAAEIVVTRCDVTDSDAVTRFATGIADHPVTLLLHTAVDYVDATLPELTADAVETAAASKVLGAELVVATVPRTPDCRVVLFSSVVATLGGRGQILYAATNRLLDVAARRFRADGVDCVSVQWGLWNVAGLLDEDGWTRIKGTGLLPMYPADAIAAGLTPHDGDVTVAAADWPRLIGVFDAFGQGSILAELPPGDPARGNRPATISAPTSGAAQHDRRPWPNGGSSAVPAPGSPIAGMPGSSVAPQLAATVHGVDSGYATGTGPRHSTGVDPLLVTVADAAASVQAVTGVRPGVGIGSGGVGAAGRQHAGDAGSDSAASDSEPAAALTDEALEEHVRGELEAVMGADGELTDGSIPLVALGLDSVQALEFRRRIKSVLDRDIQVADILSGASLDDVVLMVTGAGV